ncbi:YdbH domain-containing protein [Marinobacter antarcticus]|uniref:Dicarboxylate transport n=1 Tax=Marinobacter antarcticus TaxID=564117 RepID=A0A831R2X4_9GAMM|nr:YdbH domain-containing protein [Marinobacter antarcticus]HEA51006.1 hypothetical protein [Marinobacter antarcticus]
MRIGRKRLGWVLFTVWLVSILVSALAVRYFWNEALERNGIETLEWQGLDLSLSGASLLDLRVTQVQPTRNLVIRGTDLTLGWHWPEWGAEWLPRLTALQVGHLELYWATKPDVPSASKQAQADQWPPGLQAWMPSEVTIKQFDATLPCETGRCSLAGSLSITRSPSNPDSGPASSLAIANASLPVEARVQLDHEGHQIDLLAALSGSWDDALSFSAELDIDGIRYLSAKSSYSSRNAHRPVSWDGSFEMPDLPQTDWLLAWLQAWQSLPLEDWPKQPQAGSLQASWALQGPEIDNFLAQATGRVSVQARVPQPWPAPGLGKISGSLAVVLNVAQGQWQPETLEADIELVHPAAWIKRVPALMRPDSLTLAVRPGDALEPVSPNNVSQNVSPTAAARTGVKRTLLPLNVDLSTRGGANLSVRSHLAVATGAPWRVELGKTRLSAALPKWEVGGWLLTKPKVQVALSGWLDTTTAALKFSAPTAIEADTLSPVSESAAVKKSAPIVKGLRVELAQTDVNARFRLAEGELDAFTLSGPVGVKAQQIEHPQLLAQSWQFNGRVDSRLAQVSVTGVLKAHAGTTMNLDLTVPHRGLLTLEGKMRISGKQEAEALSRIVAACSPLLTVSGGTISANATYEQPQNGEKRLAGKLVFADWSGTFDRTAWSRMNGSADISVKNDRIRVTTPELSVEQVSSGLPIGPVQLAAHYEAPLGQMAAGQLTLERAESDALGGQIRIQPGSWNLANAPVTVPVELTQLSLARLLQIYPTEGLAGTGILSGTVPVLFDPATGVSVEQGRIDALKPGGRLQLTAERLKALASQSKSMELVAKALEDFRYSILDSGIDYGEDGTLVLNLHLEGSSPKVGNGQAVVLNINLEENIPALLTSLQLSGRVSDAVTERVKKLLQKREPVPGDLLQ